MQTPTSLALALACVAPAAACYSIPARQALFAWRRGCASQRQLCACAEEPALPVDTWGLPLKQLPDKVEGASRVLSVDGDRVALDDLGPVIVTKEGRLRCATAITAHHGSRTPTEHAHCVRPQAHLQLARHVGGGAAGHARDGQATQRQADRTTEGRGKRHRRPGLEVRSDETAREPTAPPPTRHRGAGWCAAGARALYCLYECSTVHGVIGWPETRTDSDA